MILKMVEIHQVDYIDDISKEFVDGGDRSIQSLLRHSVVIIIRMITIITTLSMQIKV